MENLIKICKKYDILLIETSINSALNKTFWNSKDKNYESIILGPFDNEEFKLISFFHELGHIQDRKEKNISCFENGDPNPTGDPYLSFDEASAWKTGIKIAKEFEIEFSQAAIEYAKSQLSTYFGDDESNQSPISKLDEAIKYAFDHSN